MMLHLTDTNNIFVPMKESIITAKYNRAQLIVICIESVLNQNYSNMEYLNIDDDSSNAAFSILKKYQTKYDFIKRTSESDQDIYDALNKRIILVTAYIVGFVYSDDLLASRNVLQKRVKVFEKYRKRWSAWRLKIY